MANDVSGTQTPSIVFIGTPTIDRLFRNGVTHQAFGGAAFISALAARRSGASVGIVARVPTKLPLRVASVFGTGGLDRAGLQTADGALPGFGISYDANDRATYDQMNPELESQLCAADVPDHWLQTECKWIHIAGIGASAAQQLRMVNDIRHRAPSWAGTLSGGTCRAMLEADPEGTLELLSQCDVFFLNREEFKILCGDTPPPGHKGTIVVTDGGEGVRVFGGAHEGLHPVRKVKTVDPTGAGDSFCGGYIGATVIEHENPVQQGIQIAADVLQGLGADALIDWVAERVNTRADHVPDAIEAMAPIVQQYGQRSAFDFAQPPHLPVNHTHALPMLIISTMHQYGFWTADVQTGWQKPMYAMLDGKTYKGSDFIWAAFSRAAREHPALLDIERMATTPRLFEQICTADDGRCPVPDLASHNQLHQAHGQAMMERWPGGYAGVLRQANATPTPVKELLQIIGELPGYMADPLAKKANLLAVILAARPEGFLKPLDPEHIQPIVDYHMMRVCLRTGLVRIHDPDLALRIDTRQWVDCTEELAIRQATGRAILGLANQTDCTIADIDGLFFKIGRTHCLETEEPQCKPCPLNPVCAKNTARFQPVFRTTAY